MNESFWTHVSEPEGPTHSGSGDQYNYFNLSSPGRAAVRNRRKYVADQLVWLLRRFVPPGNFHVAREVLRRRRMVLIDAPPGSGRTATAKMLLWERRRAVEELHEILVQADEPWQGDQISDGDLVWLDLTETSRTRRPALHADLIALHGALEDHDAYLAVALPWPSRDLPAELDSYRVTITAPSAAEVLHRCLLMDGVPRGPSLSSIPFLRSNPPLRAIPKYARLVAEAREKDGGRGDFAVWSAAAETAMSGWQHAVVKLISDQQEGAQRALLIATAMLDEAHSDAIHSAAAALLNAARHPPDDQPLLTQEPLDQRLDLIQAGIDSSGHVRFKEYGFGHEVRTYCWNHFPWLHDPVREWVAQSLGSTDLTEDEKNLLVRRFTRLCAPARYQRLWTSLVTGWTSAGFERRKVIAAASVLDEGLQDDQHSRIFRRQIYDWSTGGKLADGLATAIVMACRDRMLITHPDEALVRLHHVARHEGQRLARNTLAELVREDRRLLRYLLSRLTDRAFHHRPVDIRLFLETIDPGALIEPSARGRPLIDEPVVRQRLVTGWQLAFVDIAADEWSASAGRWLALAADDVHYRDTLLDVLIVGAEGRTGPLATLLHLTYSDSRLRTEIGDLVMRKINRAQGLPLP